jgi:DNA-binding MarR family transcriptional regulator
MSHRRLRNAEASTKTGIVRDDVAVSVDAFRRILRELRVIARKSELATGLSPAQIFVLSVVAERPAASLNEIAAATLTDRSSVAAVVDRLVENGYAVRDTSDEDRRRAAIRITALGRRAMRRAAPPPTVVLLRSFRDLSPDELRGLASGLVAVTRALGIADAPAGMLFEDGAGRLDQPRRATAQSKSVRHHGRDPTQRDRGNSAS